MSYSWLTFAQAKTALASRLGDTSKIFWLDAELGLYLQDSLRTFNSISNFHKDSVSFLTNNGFTFYDLTSTIDIGSITSGTGALSTNPPALCGYSLTDRDLTTIIQYHLIEPLTTDWTLNTPAMSEQFSNDDIVRALERRRNLFLLETGIHLTHSQVSYTLPNTTGRISLSDSIIDIRRASWLDSNSDFSPLWRSDEFESSTLKPSWNTTQATPESYSFYLAPKVSIQIIPRSNANGTLDLITVNNPSNLNTSTNVLLNIPDDFAWVIKYGALADLLSREGQAYDPVRAKYCQSRWEHGIQIAINYSLIQQAYVTDSPIMCQDIHDFDSLLPTWQDSTGTPTDIAICGRNLIALYPTPNSSLTTISLSILRNSPIPAIDADFLQIGREQFDIILDYATHLAMFKCSGVEFESTFPLLERFMSISMENNNRLSAEARNFSIMKNLSNKEEIDRPRVDTPIE